MGVEYRHYLIPEDNTFSPDPEALCRLVNALLDGDFVPLSTADRFSKNSYEEATSDCVVQTKNRSLAFFPCPCSPRDVAALGDQDFKLCWSVQSLDESGLVYPLVSIPEFCDPYYEIEIHMASDFIECGSELIDPLVGAACRCGRKLDYWDQNENVIVFSEKRLHRVCPACGRPFRPQEFSARVRDGRTGVAIDRPGGVTYRFAVVVDCGKAYPTEWPIRATEAFLGAVTESLGQRFDQVGDVY